MCKLCDAGFRQNHFGSRRNFLKGAAATGSCRCRFSIYSRRVLPRRTTVMLPNGTGGPGRRYVIRGGAVMSMDPKRRRLSPRPTSSSKARRSLPSDRICMRAAPREIDASGRIVMPGFIDTHHHQFETALRSFLADGVLINDGSGSPSGSTTYFEYILLKFAPVYRPQDVYINELFGGLSQLDDGVTTVHDVSQIHHSPQHSDAAIQALIDTGRRAAFGYFESAGQHSSAPIPATNIRQDATRINNTVVLRRATSSST